MADDKNSDTGPFPTDFLTDRVRDVLDTEAIQQRERARRLQGFKDSRKEAIEIQRREAKQRRTYSILVLVFCAIVLATLAFLFRNSVYAVVPLAGIVLFLVMWPLYDKIRDLTKFSAEFGADRLSLNLSSEKDELGFLKSELLRKKAELEILEIEKRQRVFKQPETEEKQLLFNAHKLATDEGRRRSENQKKSHELELDSGEDDEAPSFDKRES
jgi:hypothetical protein